MNPYCNIPTNWESSGSSRGELLLDYAKQALVFLENGTSIRFTPQYPISIKRQDEQLTLSFLSGGTSGVSQSVVHCGRTIGAAVGGLLDRVGQGPVNSVCCLPLWHVGGWMQLERAWATGGKVFFCSFRDLISSNIKEKISEKWISLVPTQLQELIKFAECVENLKRAKGIFVGGAGMSETLIQETRSLGLRVSPCYGSSETAGMVTLLDSEDFLSGGVGVGHSLSHAQIRINPDNGLIRIKSESLCLSRKGKRFSRNSWLETPDLGEFDVSGNLIILGRTDRIINTGGEKVNPFTIENILYATGLVEECLVYGEPDEKWGERVVACICPSSTNIKALQEMVKDKLTGCLKPKLWKSMDAIPRSKLGKYRQQ